MKRALEIGPGNHQAAQPGDGYEWQTSDCLLRVPMTHRDPAICHWGYKPLPFDDGEFDLFYAAHVLEHIPWMQTADALSEAFRVMSPGGTIELWVPDFHYLVRCYLGERCGDSWRHENPDDDYMKWLNGRLYTYGPEPNFHKACFDATSLREFMRKAGFVDTERLTGGERGHKHGPISLGMRGTKP